MVQSSVEAKYSEVMVKWSGVLANPLNKKRDERGRVMIKVESDWTPTPENINALPERVRKYIHDLEAATCADLVQENSILEQNVSSLYLLFEEQAEKIEFLKGQVSDLMAVIKRLQKEYTCSKCLRQEGALPSVHGDMCTDCANKERGLSIEDEEE